MNFATLNISRTLITLMVFQILRNGCCNHQFIVYSFTLLSKSHLGLGRKYAACHVVFSSSIRPSQIQDECNYDLKNEITSSIDNAVVDDDKKTLFQLTTDLKPTGDQPEAIRKLSEQVEAGNRFSVLHGITGTGKTFVMSHLIAKANRPCLILCHNKTLAAQLAREFRSFFNQNSVELFVSYYNHYVPESFKETTGRYMAKKSSVNSEIDTLRHRATTALISRDDVVIVSSVSCIYGLGLPKEYLDASIQFSKSMIVSWSKFINDIHLMLYDVSDDDEGFARGQYQVSNSVHPESGLIHKVLLLWPPYESFPMQIHLKNINLNEIRSDQYIGKETDLFQIHGIRHGQQQGFSDISTIRIFPAKHHVVSEDRLEAACLGIEDELETRLKELKNENKLVEADRLQKRVTNDVFMMRETGFCSGGENYSRHLAGKEPGSPPYTLLDYFATGMDGQPRDWLLIIDESHVAVPQLSAMYHGDQARKRMLVKHGYRLPSALDNRPLKDDEFWQRVQQAVFVSATPSKRELSWATESPVVKMLIRPTYVCDPEIEIRPKDGQLHDLLSEIKKRVSNEQNEGSRTLVTTLTKRDAEDLSSYFKENDVKCTFIHSGLTTHQRSDALKALQSGDIDCLVGVNLLREGLDLPQVSLVAVLNADAEGFLRCETSLLQTVGRAARNVDGKAIFYADRITASMKACIDVTTDHRTIQLEHNNKFGKLGRSTLGSSVLTIFELLKTKNEDEILLLSESKTTDRKPDLHKKEITSSTVLTSNTQQTSLKEIDTDHIPSSPGVYFWRDKNGDILYVGKAVKLRSRIKSYLLAKTSLSQRIRVMMTRATSVDFILTPSERDALILESKLIKHHQPMFNVLLKDDEHYPYICASIGDSIPRLFVVPHKHEKTISTMKYRYYGPYTSFKEVNAILDGVEQKYGLRAQSFLVRHGSTLQATYNELFDSVLNDVFRQSSGNESEYLVELRKTYEEAGLLFDSKYNRCRDVVAISRTREPENSLVVHVIQLRDGIVAGSFTYGCNIPFGVSTDDDLLDALHEVLAKRHYSESPTENFRFPWFPKEILCSIESRENTSLKIVLDPSDSDGGRRKKTISIVTAAKSGPKRMADTRALEFASQNADQAAIKMHGDRAYNVPALLDGTALRELGTLLALKETPSRIECFDVSHTQGSYPVASRVVFVEGRPAPHLYRLFNVRPSNGGDDYSSLEEVVERRCRRLNQPRNKNSMVKLVVDEAWLRPDLIVIDGGKAQLGAAINGMRRAREVAVDNEELSLAQDDSDLIAVCAIAKREEKVYIPGRDEPVNNSLGSASPAMLLLRALRDESHRFALNAHRRRRSIRKSL